MSNRTTLWLAGSLALLGGLYANFDKVSGPTDDELKSPALAKFTPDQVESIDIISRTETARLVRVGKGWQIQQPFTATAAAPDVEQMLTDLSALKADRVVAENVPEPSLKQYGLDKPSTRFVVHLKDSKETPSVDVGEHSPSGSSFYLHQDKVSSVYVGGTSLTAFLIKKAEDWRLRAPISYDTEKVERFEVVGPKVHFEASKAKGSDEWTFSKPAQRKGEPGEIKRYLDGIKGAPIRTFLPKLKEGSPQTRPLYTIKVWQSDSYDPVTLTIGSPADPKDAGPIEGSYAVRGDALHEVFIYPKPSLEALAPDFAQLAEHTLFDIDVDKLASAEVRIAGRPAILATKPANETTWSFTAPVKRIDELGKLTALAYTLKKLKYVGAVSKADELAKAKASLSSPQMAIVLRDAKTTVAALEIGASAPGQNLRYVRKVGDSLVYLAEITFVPEWATVEQGLHQKAPGDSPAAHGASPAAARPSPSGGATAAPVSATPPDAKAQPASTQPAPARP